MWLRPVARSADDYLAVTLTLTSAGEGRSSTSQGRVGSARLCGRFSVLLAVSGGLACVLLDVPFHLPAFRAVLVAFLARLLRVTRVLSSGFPRVLGGIAIVPTILAPLGARRLRVGCHRHHERGGGGQDQC